MRVILASKSPRRAEILSAIVGEFSVVSIDTDESCLLRRPCRRVTEIAKAKAKPFLGERESLVITADTLVYQKSSLFRAGKFFGKPKDSSEARSFFRQLSDKWHKVYTGVVILYKGMEYTFWEVSKVKFKKLSEEFINNYIASGSPFDKAGGYGIQDDGIVLKYKGSYTNIVGLPKEKLAKKLKEIGCE